MAETRERALKKIRDMAAELLEIYAKRQMVTQGCSLTCDDEEYSAFVEDFPFIETEDQHTAIDAVVHDLKKEQPMERLLCGDVGFGKTEVAMRAAFIATAAGKQAAILAPTTLLTQQHHATFIKRFANFPVNIAELSRFRSTKEQAVTLQALADGKVDIVIGTHKLLSKNIKFKNLGLMVIDEEHRFGVSHKEKLKQYKETVNMLAMSATPIPRTLNMSLAKVRDLSMITTAPNKRLSVKTFVHEHRNDIVKEAIEREILRGGQVYYLHNNVKSIPLVADKLEKLLPDLKIAIAHGQMPEKKLEKVMQDFYHNRYQLLLCSTIIETGLDIPNVNTIIIDRADNFGLAQLHQLRGRVGRSHHQAYAYLLTPPKEALTKDAKKRLDALTSVESLGAGFMVAQQDLEIRGAGELLGQEQSGHMENIGFSLYMELLDIAVKNLQQGKTVDTGTAMKQHEHIDVDLNASAILPEDYVLDVTTRLEIYKRISLATNKAELDDIQIEMIDRFGVLPEAAKNLFTCEYFKLQAKQIGISKINAHSSGVSFVFIAKPNINPDKIIKLIQTDPRQYRLDKTQKLICHIKFENPADRIAYVAEMLEEFGS
ncbi:MAG: transcription-repair coupling factor [Thiotrichales bacterium]|nr:MAG: transcription-repair coupling factor [Thiotrichales bacterium]